MLAMNNWGPNLQNSIFLIVLHKNMKTIPLTEQILDSKN